MSTEYPAALDDSSSLPDPSTTDKTNSPSHADLHATTNAAIKAVEAKVGTGDTTPAANQILRGTGTGTSEWGPLTSAQLAAIVSNETGSGSLVFATTPTLVTPKVDTINEATSGNGVTIDSLSIKDGKLNTANSVVESNITNKSVTPAKVGAGIVVQEDMTLFSDATTGTTAVPLDNTIPQSTEGTEFMTMNFTPLFADSKLTVEAKVFAASGTAGRHIIAALFKGSDSDALAADAAYMETANALDSVRLGYEMTSGTTSQITFKVRVGPAGGASTITLNGQAGTRVFGAIPKSYIKVTEVRG